MASKSVPITESERAKIHEEALEDLAATLDRLKAMYEQYFLGIAKVAPGPLHAEVERKLRDLTQANIRQTRLRYMLVSLQQKFSSYNAYWRRTLREIESGRYVRNLSKIGRDSIAKGVPIPEEILAAMPKRMREQVIRDRDAALARAGRRKGGPSGEFATEEATDQDAFLNLGDGDVEEAPLHLEDDEPAEIREPVAIRETIRRPAPNRPHQLTKDDADFDLDAFFAQVESEPDPPPPPRPSAARVAGAQPGRPSASAMPPPRPSAPALPPDAPVTPAPTSTMPGVARIQSRAMPPVIVGQPRAPAPPPPPPTDPLAPPPRPSTRPMGSASPQGGFPINPRTTPGIAPVKAPLIISQPPPVRPPDAPAPPPPPTQSLPRVPSPRQASQNARPLTIQPGISEAHPAAPVQTVSSGQFKRAETPAPALRPPPGMSDADVNALHANYIKAKQLVGEDAGPGSRDKLLRTINAQAPKIMDQYKADAVDFSVVVKDNQVIIRAKPKGKP